MAIRTGLSVICIAVALVGTQLAPGILADSNAASIVAAELDSFRKANQLPALKRVAPTEEEIELTCTAALTGREVREPKQGAFETYVTADLRQHPEPFLLMALGTSQFPGESFRRPVYVKGFPRYSLVVFSDRTSTAEQKLYRVGIQRRDSAFAEWSLPITFDNPLRDSNDWKDQVTPECRHS